MLGLQKKVEVESRELYHDRSVATRGTVDHAKRGNPPEFVAAPPTSRAGFLNAQQHGHWTGELTRHGRDGERIVVDSRMVMERAADGPPLVFETDHPITARKRMEEDLRRQAGELLTADRNKDEFLAVLAHELRNPLSPLTNALEVVKNPAAPPAVLERAWQIMTHQVHNMARLVGGRSDNHQAAVMEQRHARARARPARGSIDLAGAPHERVRRHAIAIRQLVDHHVVGLPFVFRRIRSSSTAT
jgi:signal transduction histidine kinase